MNQRPFRAVAALAVTLTTALTPLLAGAQATYEYKNFKPGLVVSGTASSPETPAPPPTEPEVVPDTSASLRGDGASLSGACATGKTGCAVLSSTDKNEGVSLDAGQRTASTTLGTYPYVRATIALASDKYYWEVRKVAGNSTTNAEYYCGVSRAESALSGTPFYAEPTAYASYAYSVPIGTVFRCSYDGATRVLTAKYGGTVATKTLAAGTYHPMLVLLSNYSHRINFGQEAFTYAPPTGYQAGVFVAK